MSRLRVMSVCMVASVAIAVALATLGPPRAQASFIPQSELARMLGGTCANKRCASVNCSPGNPSNCPAGLTGWCSRVGTKCLKAVWYNYARCNENQPGYNCTETSLNGCIVLVTGDPDPWSGYCFEVNCSVSSSTCGDVQYHCTSESCPPND